MIEDKLTHDERLRLEALAQAVSLFAPHPASPKTITAAAIVFEAWIRYGDLD